MGDSPLGPDTVHGASSLKKHLEYLWLPGASVEHQAPFRRTRFYCPESNPASGVTRASKEPALSHDVCLLYDEQLSGRSGEVSWN
jgi:hypothetical protein